MAMEEIMRQVTGGRAKRIQWSMTDRLEDVDVADGICMLSPRHCDIEDKLEYLEATAQEYGLEINDRRRNR